MGTEVIGHEIVDDLQQVTADIVCLATEHKKCTACHCYRELAEEAIGTLDLVSGHDELVDGGAPPGVAEAAARLRDLLASSEGTHG